MTDWEIMKEIAFANNNGDQDLLAKVILDNEIDGKGGVIRIAISSFELTESNVFRNIDAAKKLAKATKSEDFRTRFRHAYLNELIKSVAA